MQSTFLFPNIVSTASNSKKPRTANRCARLHPCRDGALTLLTLHRRPKPFAFIEFIDYNEARDAKEAMDRREFQGRQIDVVFAQQRRESSATQNCTMMSHFVSSVLAPVQLS